MGENARDEAQWLLSALPLWGLHSCGSCECLEPWLKRQTSAKLGYQGTIKHVLKHRCLKWPCIVHLNLICMSYDQKKGRESNWEFDSRPQIPGKKGPNEVWLRRAIHHCKGLLRAIRYFLHIFKTNLIWKIYEWPKFWDSRSPNFGKVTFGCSICGEAHNIL
jgi:hypothetical protein